MQQRKMMESQKKEENAETEYSEFRSKTINQKTLLIQRTTAIFSWLKRLFPWHFHNVSDCYEIWEKEKCSFDD